LEVKVLFDPRKPSDIKHVYSVQLFYFHWNDLGASYTPILISAYTRQI